MGYLFNMRQDVPSRAAFKYNRHSMGFSSYLSSIELVPEGPNSMLGPSPRAIAEKRVPSIKEFGPPARFIPWPYGKPGATSGFEESETAAGAHV